MKKRKLITFVLVLTLLCSCLGVTVTPSAVMAESTIQHLDCADDCDCSMHAVSVQKTSNKVYTLSNIPKYSGKAYVELNKNVPNFTDKEKKNQKAFENYSKLDSLGRCGVAYANVCKETMPTEERGAIGMIKPSGWHTVKYKGVVDGNYLYNRCHLIGYQLTGENANKKNLITGTRYLNMEGMLEFEILVADYVDKTNNHVLYRVTPIFKGKNLLASGVQMEGWSVEDSGKGVCFNVYCYNVQPGIKINYSTGDSSLEKDSNKNSSNKDTSKKGNDSQKLTVIINKNTKKFHLPSCSSVKSMKNQNKKKYTGTVKELKKKGYSPCQRCLAKYK